MVIPLVVSIALMAGKILGPKIIALEGKTMNVAETDNVASNLNDFFEGLSTHPVFNNDYFQYIKENKWNPQTYELYRANFFYRTELTVKGIAHVCARSAAVNDMDTLILFAYILSEETGFGNKAHCHEFFMENALNIYGETEFSLAPTKVQEAKYSEYIIPETVAYRERIQELISDSYPRMLGVAMALETHADIMLTNFRDAFRKNRKKLPEDVYQNKVEVYFNSHVESGVEERHAEDARMCVINNCKTREDYNEIKHGALGAIEVQQEMWDAMYQKCLVLA
ncbi:MAG: iron-containing redox enzyme family protein [Marinobacter sp.]|nr:iron-containing redox enzyme family protein [Marinobacter sp.]